MKLKENFIGCDVNIVCSAVNNTSRKTVHIIIGTSLAIAQPTREDLARGRGKGLGMERKKNSQCGFAWK